MAIDAFGIENIYFSGVPAFNIYFLEVNVILSFASPLRLLL